jgi:hypothetical protein
MELSTKNIEDTMLELDSLSRKIYVECVCMERDEKELAKINSDLQDMKNNLKSLEKAICSKELEYSQITLINESRKKFMNQNRIKLNNLLPLVDGKWTNKWPVSVSIAENNEPVKTTDSKVTPSQASRIKLLDKYLVNENWPYMRVKNTIKYINAHRDNPISSLRVSHYDGLQILAKHKGIHMNELIKMNLGQYIGKQDADVIIGFSTKW